MRPLSKIGGWPGLDASATDRYEALLKFAPSGVEHADATAFASVLALALTEWRDGKGALPDLIGLGRQDLWKLKAAYFPKAPLPNLDFDRRQPTAEQSSISLLLRWRGGTHSLESQWLADIIARRALEPNHLWQDLGLASRAELGSVMQRHFPRIVEMNAQQMRWKKFFYRQVCSDSGHTMCLSPVCDDCSEYATCFEPEEGQSLLAR